MRRERFSPRLIHISVVTLFAFGLLLVYFDHRLLHCFWTMDSTTPSTSASSSATSAADPAALRSCLQNMTYIPFVTSAVVLHALLTLVVQNAKLGLVIRCQITLSINLLLLVSVRRSR